MILNAAHEIALALSIILTSISQIFLKIGSYNKKKWILSLLNLKTIFGYFLFGIVTILNVFAMQKIELKTMTAWIAITYILVSVLSHFILKDRLDKNKILGSMLIVVGIVIFSL